MPAQAGYWTSCHPAALLTSVLMAPEGVQALALPWTWPVFLSGVRLPLLK